MSGQLIPITQLDALPTTTYAAALAADTFSVIGGAIAKYWGPATLGINGLSVAPVLVPDGGTGTNCYGIVTPYLDMRGCSFFAVLLRRLVGSSLTATPTFTPKVQFRMGPADAPPLWLYNAASTGNDLTGTFNIKTGVPFPSAAASGEVQSLLYTWGGMLQAQWGAAVAGGPDMRIFFDAQTAAVNPANTFTCAVWGGS